MLPLPERNFTTNMDTPLDISKAEDGIAVPQNLLFPIEIWAMIGETVRLFRVPPLQEPIIPGVPGQHA